MHIRAKPVAPFVLSCCLAGRRESPAQKPGIREAGEGFLTVSAGKKVAAEKWCGGDEQVAHPSLCLQKGEQKWFANAFTAMYCDALQIEGIGVTGAM